jgi:ubiquinol-cytochrome c reductase cytochrome b subunit
VPFPFVGPELVEFIRGDYLISDATLNRFFALHVIALPFVLGRPDLPAPDGLA